MVSLSHAKKRVEISSVLNFQDENLLVFTKDGYVVSLDKDWCNEQMCPNLTEASVTRSDNITQISELWNNSQVVGIERVDASGGFRNAFNHLQFAILVQIEVGFLTNY